MLGFVGFWRIFVGTIVEGIQTNLESKQGLIYVRIFGFWALSIGDQLISETDQTPTERECPPSDWETREQTFPSVGWPNRCPQMHNHL